MVEAIWFVIALVMLAVVSVALILMIVLQRDIKATGRETRTQYLSPNYSQSAGVPPYGVSEQRTDHPAALLAH